MLANLASLIASFASRRLLLHAKPVPPAITSLAKVENRYVLVDTAGLKDPDDEFETHIQDQIEDAVANADLILLTLDSSKYPDHNDKMIAKKAFKSGKPILFLLNKSDLGEALPDEEFLMLGAKNPIRVSATTGMGLNELRGKILSELKDLGFDTRERVEKARRSH